MAGLGDTWTYLDRDQALLEPTCPPGGPRRTGRCGMDWTPGGWLLLDLRKLSRNNPSGTSPPGYPSRSRDDILI